MAEASLGGNWLCVIDIERAARVKAAEDGRGPRSEFGIILIENDDERSAVLTRLLDCVEPRMAIRCSGFGHVGAKRYRLALITHDAEHEALRQFTARSYCLLKRNFGDRTVGLHVRRGIAEFLPEPDKYLRKSDIAIAMDGDTWAKLYLNQTDLKSAVEGGSAKAHHPCRESSRGL